MKKIIFSFLVVLMLGFSGCNKKGDNFIEYPYLPAVVTSMLPPVISTIYGKFYVPELQLENLWDGDAIGITFTVNYDQPLVSEYPTAYNTNYDKIGQEWAQGTPGGESTSSTEFNVPIEDLAPIALIENIFFFTFKHTAPSDQEYKYEITYDQDITDDLVLYIRAKKIDNGSKPETTIYRSQAFGMYYFFSRHMDADKNVTFQIKYKNGMNEDGSDKYELCKDNNGNSSFKLKVE